MSLATGLMRSSCTAFGTGKPNLPQNTVTWAGSARVGSALPLSSVLPQDGDPQRAAQRCKWAPGQRRQNGGVPGGRLCLDDNFEEVRQQCCR